MRARKAEERRRAKRAAALPWLFVAILCLTLSDAQAPAWAQSEDREQASRYLNCMDLTDTNPDQALEAAQTWIDLGGGDPARHCAAVALMRLGHYRAAGEELEKLSASLEKSFVYLQIPILIQAGQAWFDAGELDRAHAIQSAALARQPNNVDLLVDRALTSAAFNDFESALSDLTRAQSNAPDRADILVLRATAYRFLDQLERAMADVEWAIELDPENGPGFLERGNLHRLAGDNQGARDDWIEAANLAPSTPTAQAAQANLANMDLKVE